MYKVRVTVKRKPKPRARPPKRRHNELAREVALRTLRPDPMKQVDIARELGVSRQAVHETIRRLDEAGVTTIEEAAALVPGVGVKFSVNRAAIVAAVRAGKPYDAIAADADVSVTGLLGVFARVTSGDLDLPDVASALAERGRGAT